MKDYRIDGPPEAQQIVRDHRPCETRPNGTGMRCTCAFDCANYWLRAKGFKAGASAVPAEPAPAPRGSFWANLLRAITRT